jgi:competence protein ComEA
MKQETSSRGGAGSGPKLQLPLEASDDAAADGAGSGLVARLRSAVRDSPWASLAGKLALYGAAVVVLALVGSGKWLAKGAPPHASAHLGVAMANAASAVSARTPPPAPPPPVASAGDAGVRPDGPAREEPAVTEDGRVAINRATERDLRRLPGIGPTKAKAIIAMREKLGRFKKPEDLLRIKGFGRRSLARLRPLIVID